MSQAASSSIDPTPPQYAQAPRRRIRLLVVAGTAVLTAATLGVIALTGERPDEGTADTVRTAHTGMVTGTVWVANEDGGTLTAIDAT